MTRLFNDPTVFADEMIEGFVAASSRWVRPVSGGVVRRSPAPEGSVAVVIGGGSGHYPAFAGLVGDGLAHGAAMGNLFASPSAQQVHAVAAATERGGGVLLTYGNYAGDVLNFDQAQERLRAEGIACETVTVTDDISSAPAGDRARRRGIAGDLAVFKAASAAADAGYDLAGVARVARAANERTRSFGVAFSGCTLPGADEPLFTVPEGRMAIGLGIHGEPGIGEADLPSADELALLFVDALLGEMPDGIAAEGSRAAVILNGLGSVKYEELFVVYRRVALLLAERGVTIVEPEVGELCTSFDMAGASLTLFWLDDELERLWRAPADAPGYSKRHHDIVGLADDAPADLEAGIPLATPASLEAAATAGRAIEAIAAVIEEHAEELGRIDAVAGDGDHGIGMRRGASSANREAAAVLARGAGLGTALERAGDAWAARAGGTSGALWGVILRTAGSALGDADRPTAGAVAAAVTAASDAVRAFGKAELGDKTMVDVLVPFAESLAARAADGPLAAAWAGAAADARVAAAATADLLPRIGRARPHAEKSLGTPDAGAVSLALIVTAVAEVLDQEGSGA
ncbi:MAG: dihydroxyacetone kinase [Rhodoglobus sp.]|nr:dihydroxyacetone kinase [Rhodoglobus sp.]